MCQLEGTGERAGGGTSGETGGGHVVYTVVWFPPHMVVLQLTAAHIQDCLLCVVQV